MCVCGLGAADSSILVHMCHPAAASVAVFLLPSKQAAIAEAVLVRLRAGVMPARCISRAPVQCNGARAEEFPRLLS